LLESVASVIIDDDNVHAYESEDFVLLQAIVNESRLLFKDGLHTCQQKVRERERLAKLTRVKA
jgi:hypothetical protein